jgi:hypothetical protein
LECDAARAVLAGVEQAAAVDARRQVRVVDTTLRDQLVRLALHAGLSPTFTTHNNVEWLVQLDSSSSSSSSSSTIDPLANDTLAPLDNNNNNNDYTSQRTWCFTMPRRCQASGFVVVRRALLASLPGARRPVVVQASRASIQGSTRVLSTCCRLSIRKTLTIFFFFFF